MDDANVTKDTTCSRTVSLLHERSGNKTTPEYHLSLTQQLESKTWITHCAAEAVGDGYPSLFVGYKLAQTFCTVHIWQFLSK